MRGEIEAAAAHALPRLDRSRRPARRSSHAQHRNATARTTCATMADGGARKRGSNTSRSPITRKSLAMANGLDERRALEHAARIRAIDAEGRGVRLLAGVGMRHQAGRLARPRRRLPRRARSRRRLGALGVRSGPPADDRPPAARASRTRTWTSSATRPDRRILKRRPYPLDMDAVIDAAAARMASPSRSTARSTGWISTRSTRSWLATAACALVISSDAHSRPRARRRCAGAYSWPDAPGSSRQHVLNTRPFDGVSARPAAESPMTTSMPDQPTAPDAMKLPDADRR